MANYGNKFLPHEMITVDSSTLTGSYAALNGSGFDNPLLILKVVNDSNVDITFSIDGTLDHDVCVAGQSFVYDIQTNHAIPSDNLFLSQGTILYGKGNTGSGNIYIVSWYASK